LILFWPNRRFELILVNHEQPLVLEGKWFWWVPGPGFTLCESDGTRLASYTCGFIARDRWSLVGGPEARCSAMLFQMRYTLKEQATGQAIAVLGRDTTRSFGWFLLELQSAEADPRPYWAWAVLTLA
jgi:hypothetical protein